MVKKRTEEEKVTRAPIEVILGGEKYEVKPLVIRDSRAWRNKIVGLLAELPSHLEATSDKPDDFEAALKALLVTMPDTIVDLFFEYAKDLDPKVIEGIATDDEVAEALGKVMEVAFPLSQSLSKVMDRVSR